MKFEDGPLKSYLIKSLQPLTAADPSILANYVIALLKNNKPKKELQNSCNEKLFDFLGEETKQFVSKLFHDLEDGSLLEAPEGSVVPPPGEPAAVAAAADQKSSPTQTKPNVSGDESSDDEDDDRNHKHRRRVSRSRSSDKEDERSQYRKRSRSTENGHYSRENHRYYENRRNSYRGRDREHSLASRIVVDGTVIHGRAGLPFRNDRYYGPGIQRGVGGGRGGSWLPPEQQRFGAPAPFSEGEYPPALLAQGPPGSGLFPGRVPGGGGRAGQFPGGFGLLSNGGALEHVLPLGGGGRGNPVAAIAAIARPRCLDFEERGFCLRGDLCPMEHGANRIVVEDVQSLSKLTLPISNTRSGGGGEQSTSTDMGAARAACRVASRDVTAGGTDEAGNPSSAASDTYDPDQPLWGKEQTDKVRQFHSDQQRHEWQNSASAAADADNGGILKTPEPGKPLDPTTTVWDRIGPVDYHRRERERGERAGLKRQREEPDDGPSGNGHNSNNNNNSGGEKRREGSKGERAQRTLYIRSIPSESNKPETLRAHFQRFGEVVDIRKPAHYSDRAFVQFAQPEHAEAALASPEAVLGNRFVRVSWANRDNRVAAPAPVSGENGGTENPAPQPGLKKPVDAENGALVQKKQEELQQMKEELRKKQEALAAKRDEFKRQLEKLAKQPRSAPENSLTPAAAGESKTPTKPVKAPVARAAQPFGNPSSPWGRFKLDNRTATFRILTPPPAAISALEALREHFATFGEVSEVSVDRSSEAEMIQVSFAGRRDAEKAFSQGNSWQGQQLQFSWFNPPAPAAAAASAPQQNSSPTIDSSPVPAAAAPEIQS